MGRETRVSSPVLQHKLALNNAHAKLEFTVVEAWYACIFTGMNAQANTLRGGMACYAQCGDAV